MAAVRHIGFVKFNFFNVWSGKETHFAPAYQNFVKIGQTVADISQFWDFQDGSRRHLGFSKIRNFNGRSAVRGEFASPCQISSKSVKRLQSK